MKRLMMVAPHFEDYTFLLARAIAAQNIEVLLVLHQGMLEAEYHDRARPPAPGVTIRHNAFRTPMDFMRLMTELVRFRPDVLHWQEASGLIKTAMSLAMVTTARAFLLTALTVHDPVPHGGRDAAIARRLARLRRAMRARVHVLFVHGPRGRDQYLHAFLPPPHHDERVRLTQHGVILVGEGAPPEHEEFRALMFGRMEAYKGLDILSQATAKLAAEGQSFGLEIAGSGPELDRLEHDLAAIQGVRIDNSFVSSAALIEKMRAAACVVLPYLSATQSGVLAAAFANNRFVIASRVGAIPDLVEHGVNGLLVEPGDVEGLAQAIRSVAIDPALRRRLRDGARETAATRLDWGRISAELVAEYDRCLVASI